MLHTRILDQIDLQPWQIEALLVVLGAGGMATLVGLGVTNGAFQVMSLVLLFYGGLLVPRTRQPHAKLYQPRGFATRLLKWVSAPQVEAAILFWVGWSFLVEPTRVSVFRLSQSLLLSQALGFGFVLLGWVMATRAPKPRQYVVITSTRLLYTLIVIVDVLLSDVPLVVIGIYVGSVLHGIISMLVQWTLYEVAADVRKLEGQVQRLQAERGGVTDADEN